MHPIVGFYFRGNALTITRCLVSDHTHSSTSQLHSDKCIQLAKISLHTRQNNTTSMKFSGKLEVTNNSGSVFLSELNMESLLRPVGDISKCFCLVPFFTRWTLTKE